MRETEYIGHAACGISLRFIRAKTRGACLSGPIDRLTASVIAHHRFVYTDLFIQLPFIRSPLVCVDKTEKGAAPMKGILAAAAVAALASMVASSPSNAEMYTMCMDNGRMCIGAGCIKENHFQCTCGYNCSTASSWNCSRTGKCSALAKPVVTAGQKEMPASSAQYKSLDQRLRALSKGPAR